jgi:sirohydrochlorin ferrochelatase
MASIQQAEQGTGLTAIILVDHGSRFAAANDMLNEVAERFRRTSGYKIVEPAHMELAEPSIPQAFASCVRQGATRIVVHPYFLSPGRHSTTDIPRMVADAAAAYPSVVCNVTQPLGLDDEISRIILNRIHGCELNGYTCEICASRGGCMVRNQTAAGAQTGT